MSGKMILILIIVIIVAILIILIVNELLQVDIGELNI